MTKKRAFASEEGDCASNKRARTEPSASASNNRNMAINTALSRANIGKKYSWMNRDTGALEKPQPPAHKAEGKEGEEGLADYPGSPESYTASAPVTVVNGDPIQPSIENTFGDASEEFDEELAAMEKALAEEEERAKMEKTPAEDEEFDEIVAAMEKELAEDQMVKSKSGNGSSESPILISSRESSPVNIPSKEDTPAKNIAESKKPALPTPPKTDDENKKARQQKQQKPAKKPAQKKPLQKKQTPVVQEPEEDPAVAEAQEQEDLYAMLNYIYQFAY
ncbi:hypothetical protein GL218_00633 [Daldinia childiae]|uniref:uncharacterized protein n=1 Tax=Daldinia childiae TaxID=326645 RepID=UPI0014452274|nr:uncharacterized protein GL218_00633 [Daldinia childiae]KAF3070889.1 hypothetical protein GL218_00633 [Daldinia childiae]